MWTRAALILACLAALAPAAASAAPAPATFRVGVATASIDPNLAGVDVYAGGFGASPPIRTVHDPIEVRAFYISNGTHSVAMATVDAQAYFSAYQEGPDYGITSVREAAAEEIAGDGAPMTADDIIVQATHTHAGATLEGIWGPVPLPYLRLVHDQTVKALVEAERSARAAHVQIGTYDAPWLNNIDNNQTDSYPGWAADGQLSVLRAVTPTGAPIGTFVSVPTHGDIVEGSGIKQLSADYFGVVRAALDERLGGVNVVGPATLGRQETPVQVGGLPVATWFGGVVTSIVGRAVAEAHWITDDTIASANTFTRVPGTNPALLALVAANSLPDEQQAAAVGGRGHAGRVPDRPQHRPAAPDRQRHRVRPHRAADRRHRVPVDAGRAVPGDPQRDRRRHHRGRPDRRALQGPGRLGLLLPGLDVGLHVALRQRPQPLQHRPAGRRPGDRRPGGQRPRARVRGRHGRRPPAADPLRAGPAAGRAGDGQPDLGRRRRRRHAAGRVHRRLQPGVRLRPPRPARRRARDPGARRLRRRRERRGHRRQAHAVRPRLRAGDLHGALQRRRRERQHGDLADGRDRLRAPAGGRRGRPGGRPDVDLHGARRTAATSGSCGATGRSPTASTPAASA